MYQLLPIVIYAFKDTSIFVNKNIPSRSNMDPDKEIISRLKFIGKLQKGDKINVKHMYVQPDGLVTKINRTFFSQENKYNTLSFIKETTDKVFKIIATYIGSTKDADKQNCENIILDLRQSKAGMANLKETYNSPDNMKFICDIETMLQEIDVKLAEFETRDHISSSSSSN
jgi:hypothetical protein